MRIKQRKSEREAWRLRVLIERGEKKKKNVSLKFEETAHLTRKEINRKKKEREGLEGSGYFRLNDTFT